jgi:hypothetical protein
MSPPPHALGGSWVKASFAVVGCCAVCAHVQLHNIPMLTGRYMRMYAHECCWHRQQSRTSPLLTCHQGWQQYYLLVSFILLSILLLLALLEHDLEAD